jgi:hypothetical protein
MTAFPYNQENTMTEEQTRLACLDRALQLAPLIGRIRPEEVVSIAGQFCDFVNGTNDAELVRAAHDFAQKVRG